MPTVLKEVADTELVAAIREVAAGGRYVHPEFGARALSPRQRWATFVVWENRDRAPSRP